MTSKTRQDKTRQAPRALDPAIVLPPLRVQNISQSRKIRVQVVQGKFVTNICLAKQASDYQKKNEGQLKRNKWVSLDPVLTAG